MSRRRTRQRDCTAAVSLERGLGPMSQRAVEASPERVSGVAQATVLAVSAPAGKGLLGQWWAAGVMLVALGVTAGLLGSRLVGERLAGSLDGLFEGWNQQQRSLEQLAGRLSSAEQQLQQWAALEPAAVGGDASGVLVISRGQAGELAAQIRGMVAQVESLQRVAVQRQSLVGRAAEQLRRDAVAVLWAALAGVLVAQLLVGVWLGRASLRPLGRLRRDLELADQSLQALASALPRWFSRAAEWVQLASHRAGEQRAWLEGLQLRLEGVGAAAGRMREQAGLLARQAEQFVAVTDRLRDLGGESRLLGLSAAIEAARMESQGQPLGVVAEEVRRLAGESRQMVQEVTRLQRELTQAAHEAAGASRMATEELRALQSGVAAAVRATRELGAELEQVHQRLVAAGKAAAMGVRVSAARGTYDLRASIERALAAADRNAAGFDRAEVSAEWAAASLERAAASPERVAASSEPAAMGAGWGAASGGRSTAAAEGSASSVERGVAAAERGPAAGEPPAASANLPASPTLASLPEAAAAGEEPGSSPAPGLAPGPALAPGAPGSPLPGTQP